MNVSMTHGPERKLASLGLTFFGYAAFAAVLSIAAGWPAQFGGAGDPANVLGEFISRGTAAAPPLLPLLLLGVSSLAVRRGDSWAVASSVVLLALGILFVIGGVGEIRSPDPVTTPRAVLVVAGVIAGAGGVALVAGSTLVLNAWWRRRRH